MASLKRLFQMKNAFYGRFLFSYWFLVKLASDLVFGLKSSDLGLSVASVLEEVCS